VITFPSTDRFIVSKVETWDHFVETETGCNAAKYRANEHPEAPNDVRECLHPKWIS
jgi:hypothetical protein